MNAYDYIVVGAGSAGAVVANRLSADPAVTVLLIEAGGSQKHLNVRIPAAFSTQFKTELDWDYTTEPEPHLDGRRIYQPRAKMLGGCSSMNAMIYIRGNRADFDGWAKDGADGWSYDEVLPYFRRSERNSRGESTYHGADGPLHIEDHRSPNPVSRTILEAMLSTGLAHNDDFNGAEQSGAGFFQVTQKRGQRWTTADAYVDPVRRRRNLTVMTQGQVTRVRIEGGRATGVELVRDGRAESVRAEREVILSAGALNTPQLLMLSGIGAADQLSGHGIEVLVDNPNVGAHLMDHPMYLCNWDSTAKGTLAGAQSPVQLVNYLARRRGMLTSNVGEVGAFFNTHTAGEAPDMEILAAPGFFHNHGFDTHDGPAFAMGASLVGPKSRGHVRLGSADPLAKPAITFNYLADRADMDAMVAAVERIRTIASMPQLRAITRSELFPGSAVRSRAELEAAIRRDVEHTYHPACTARIGSEADGVVDSSLRVHGIAGLRVADASVFPTITRGNTHAPTVMVGEKAADLIRQEG